MQKELTRSEISALYKKINETLESDEVLKSVVVYALVKTKHALKPIAEEMVEFIDKSIKQERLLALKYCQKDENGKPVIVGEAYAGLEYGKCSEYDSELDALLEQRKKYVREKISVEIHTITKENVPESGKAHVLNLIYMLTEG